MPDQKVSRCFLTADEAEEYIAKEYPEEFDQQSAEQQKAQTQPQITQGEVRIYNKKEAYRIGENITIIVENGLQYDLNVGMDYGCEGFIYRLYQISNDEHIILNNTCGSCDKVINYTIPKNSIKEFIWDQTEFNLNSCGNRYPVSWGVYYFSVEYLLPNEENPISLNSNPIRIVRAEDLNQSGPNISVSPEGPIIVYH